jgi:hypothetical protein
MIVIQKSPHGEVFSMTLRANGEFFQPLGQPAWYVSGWAVMYPAHDLYDAHGFCLVTEIVMDVINSFMLVVSCIKIST